VTLGGRGHTRTRADVGHFSEACTRLEETIGGAFRATVGDEIAHRDSVGAALLAIRDGMRTNVWRVGAASLDLGRAVRALDRTTREEGFHALNDWDGVAVHVNPDTIPVDVLHYVVEQRGADPMDPKVPGLLLDYYFMHLLSLLSLRVWDEGDADENLDRVQRLLDALQGPGGSGQRFADDVETLLLIATSHYEAKESGYHLLLDRVRGLDRRHRSAIALGHTSSMGCHLRFGFEATYGRDTTLMRDDNVADYPWLCFALATVMDDYAREREAGTGVTACRRLAEALLNGLSPDARAFVGSGPAALSAHERERARFREIFLSHRVELLEGFEALTPSADAYSPLSFFFNFAHNVLKGAMVDALLWAQPWRLGFNDLLTGEVRDEPPERSRTTLAKTLMAYARTNPHKIRGRLMPVIVYDPEAGYRAFRLTLRRLVD
jgi:hypothetical protein